MDKNKTANRLINDYTNGAIYQRFSRREVIKIVAPLLAEIERLKPEAKRLTPCPQPSIAESMQAGAECQDID